MKRPKIGDLPIDRDELIENHRFYARNMAIEIKKSLPSYIELDELIACGELGLVEAAESYDPNRGIKFITYAHYRIRGAIYDGLRKHGFFSHREYARQRFQANAEFHIKHLLEGLNEIERVEQIEDEIELMEGLIDELIPIYILSLDRERLTEIEDNSSISEEIEEKEIVAITYSLIEKLPEKSRMIIKEIYINNLSFAQLAIRLNISIQHSYYLHALAIKQLQQLMKAYRILKE
jgi:RNA polymerase sigma factor FliA